MAMLSQDIGGGLDEYTADYRILRPDGKTIWIREFGEVEYDETGKRDSIAGTMQDITEIQALESQLRQMQKMEAIGQLSGGIAHDFNNLLGIILGNLELVSEKQTLDAPSREKIETALHATRRGAELTHRLLAFARLQPLAPRIVQVNDLILGMTALLQRPLGPTIEIAMQPAADLWPTKVDPAQLETTLLNLALNARDAMPQGGKLTVATANVHLDEDFVGMNQGAVIGDYVRIAVTDTGIGMSEPVRARAFDPFFTTKGIGKGTGLGLSMVYGFVKQSGGYIKLYSEPGHGTAVNIYLPRSQAELALVEEMAPPPHAAPADTTVLVVDDEEDILSLATESLEGWGYKVLTASDGATALAVLEANPKIDLLLTDVILPGPMDGRAVAEKARARHPGLKVVYMSGYTPNSILHGGALDPGVLHIGKPFRRSDLAQILQRALTRSDH
jgi:signal transduction histidine kinase/ActR/RegA family two-component response regulator